MTDTRACPACGRENPKGKLKCGNCGLVVGWTELGTPAVGGPTAEAFKLPKQQLSGLVGRTIGSYEIRKLLGRGSMGAVYLARHRHLGQEVAVKVLNKSLFHDKKVHARFEREARVQASLHHPNIVPVHDYIVERDVRAFVMERVQGISVAHMLRKQPDGVSAARCREIILPVLDALAFAHGRNIIHRDIKPDNIMLANVSDVEVVKVADFGLAKAVGGSAITISGTALGTLHYMCPEQCLGHDDVDHRADIYAAGITLYQLATGKLPFTGKTLTELVSAHVYHEPVAPREVNPEISLALEETILKAMAKDRDERFQNAQDFMSAMALACPGPDGSAAPPPPLAPSITPNREPTPPPPEAWHESVHPAATPPTTAAAPSKPPLPATSIQPPPAEEAKLSKGTWALMAVVLLIAFIVSAGLCGAATYDLLK